MRNIFFVDSENVGDSWIQLFDYLNDDDCILVFYTDKSPNMSYANVVALKQSPFEPEFILCENGTDNALDFQLVTYLGSYTVKIRTTTSSLFQKIKVLTAWYISGRNADTMYAARLPPFPHTGK